MEYGVDVLGVIFICWIMIKINNKKLEKKYIKKINYSDKNNNKNENN